MTDIYWNDDAADNGIIRNCVARNQAGDGICIGYGDNVRIENCLVYNNDSAGIRLTIMLTVRLFLNA